MMDEFKKFQERLDGIKLLRAGRNLEDMGLISLTNIRDSYNDLLTDIMSFLNECRRDENKYNIDEFVQVAILGNNLKEEIKNDRVDVITERLVKEDRIRTLTREKEKLAQNEALLSGYIFADETNLSDTDKIVKDLQTNIPERIREIDTEIELLTHGTAKDIDLKKTNEELGYIGKHLPEHGKEEMKEDQYSFINGVSFTEPGEEKEAPSDEVIKEALDELGEEEAPAEEEEELESVPESLTSTPDEELESIPAALVHAEEETPKEETVVEKTDDEELESVPAPLVHAEEAPAEEEEEELESVPAPLVHAEEETEEEPEVVAVTDVVAPKPTLWQKVGRALGYAIAFLAAATAVHTGLSANYLRDIRDNMADVNEEEAEEESKDDGAPVEEEEDNTAEIDVEPAKDDTPSGGGTTPVEPKEEHYTLAPGESIYDEKTGVEITSGGAATLHKDGKDTELEHRDLKKDSDGNAVVSSNDLKDTTPAKASNATPATPAPAPKQEEKKDVQTYIAEETKAGHTENVEVAQDAMEATPDDVWKSLFGSGPSL